MLKVPFIQRTYLFVACIKQMGLTIEPRKFSYHRVDHHSPQLPEVVSASFPPSPSLHALVEAVSNEPC